jgi:ribosomal protein S18 acetylase RimI-like enzyme
MGLRHLAITEAPSYFGTPKHIELAKTLGSYRRQLKFDRVNGRSLILGVWADAQLIGMAGMKIRRVQGQDLGLIYSMYVKSAYRKQGIGKKLVLKARHEIHRRWKLRTIQMNVEVGNETALRLYQSCGFKIVGKDEQAFWIDGVSHDVYVLA